MFEYNPLYDIDFYKQDHVSQYPTDTQQVWSNWTARSTRIPGQKYTIPFGLQYFLKEVLKNEWARFFWTPRSELVKR